MTGVQTCALPIYGPTAAAKAAAQGTPYSKSEVYKQMLAMQNN